MCIFKDEIFARCAKTLCPLVPQPLMAKPALTHRYALLGSVVVLFVLYLLLGGTKKTATKDWKTCKQSQPLVPRAAAECFMI